MAIARPTKALGNDQYTEEVAAGKLDIIDQEIDDDFNTVYNAVNLIDSGVFTGRIPYSSLDLAGKIQDSDLTTINAARLYGFLPHTGGGVFVDGSSIQAGTLPTGALVPGAAVYHGVALPATTLPPNLTGGTTGANTEYTLATDTITPSRGGYILLLGMVTGRVAGANSPVDQLHWTTRVRDQAGNVVAVCEQEGMTQTTAGNNIWLPFTSTAFGLIKPGVGNITLSLTWQMQTVSGFWLTHHNQANLIVVELA